MILDTATGGSVARLSWTSSSDSSSSMSCYVCSVAARATNALPRAGVRTSKLLSSVVGEENCVWVNSLSPAFCSYPSVAKQRLRKGRGSQQEFSFDEKTVSDMPFITWRHSVGSGACSGHEPETLMTRCMKTRGAEPRARVQRTMSCLLCRSR